VIKEVMSAFVQPCTTTVDKMDSVDLRFTNLKDEPISFTLKVKSDENFTFAQNSHKVTMQANEEKIIEIPITEIKETEFHHYTMEYEAVNDDGIVMAKGKTPLNFSEHTSTSFEEAEGLLYFGAACADGGYNVFDIPAEGHDGLCYHGPISDIAALFMNS
jgi:hypothetical protein